MEVTNIYKALEKAQRDEAVGIKSIRLSGDEHFALYAAEIDGQKRIGAHYHTEGKEIYQVVEGKGKMHIGIPKSDNEVDWKESTEVSKGDCFTVNKKQVHQLANTGSDKLIIIFAGPYSHISTDRIVVDGVNEE